MKPWAVNAINLTEHADNPMHLDEGARAAGFSAALVAGTTIYAYMTHLPASAWGRDWIDYGTAELRLKSPVFDNDLVECLAGETNTVSATVGGSVRATIDVSLNTTAPGPHVGERVPTFDVELGEDLGRYGIRAGDDLDIYTAEQLVHPAAWPCIGNRVTNANYVTGPWIHVRSKIAHLGPVPLGAQATVESTLVERFMTRAGERVLLDIRVIVAGKAVAMIEHESIVVVAETQSI